MFILHLDLTIKRDEHEAFEAFFRDVFHNAIAKQPGFIQTHLLRDNAQQLRTHRLVIAFESEELQRQWVATELHQAVSKELQEHVVTVCSADSFVS